MNTVTFAINITDFQSQRFAQTQTHGIRGQNKDAVGLNTGSINQLLNLGYGKHIGQRTHFGWFNNLHPAPVLFQNESPEELQTIMTAMDGGNVGFAGALPDRSTRTVAHERVISCCVVLPAQGQHRRLLGSDWFIPPRSGFVQPRHREGLPLRSSPSCKTLAAKIQNC